MEDEFDAHFDSSEPLLDESRKIRVTICRRLKGQ